MEARGKTKVKTKAAQWSDQDRKAKRGRESKAAIVCRKGSDRSPVWKKGYSIPSSYDMKQRQLFPMVTADFVDHRSVVITILYTNHVSKHSTHTYRHTQQTDINRS